MRAQEQDAAVRLRTMARGHLPLLAVRLCTPAARGRGPGIAQVLAALAETGPVPLVVPVQAGDAAPIAVLRASGSRSPRAASCEPDDPAHSREHVVLVRP